MAVVLPEPFGTCLAVKFLDIQTKATQVSQYELVLQKDSNWKIVG